MKILVSLSAPASRRPAPKPMTTSQREALMQKRAKARDEEDAATIAALKPVLPEGVKVRRKKFTHMGQPQSGVYIVGTFEKAQSVQLVVKDGKLTVQYCPPSFGGKKTETWPVKGLTEVKLTEANIQKALKKFGHSQG